MILRIISFHMLAARSSSENNDVKKSWYWYKPKQIIHLGLGENIQSIMKQRLSYCPVPHPCFNFVFIVCCIFPYLLIWKKKKGKLGEDLYRQQSHYLHSCGWVWTALLKTTWIKLQNLHQLELNWEPIYTYAQVVTPGELADSFHWTLH